MNFLQALDVIGMVLWGGGTVAAFIFSLIGTAVAIEDEDLAGLGFWAIVFMVAIVSAAGWLAVVF